MTAREHYIPHVLVTEYGPGAGIGWHRDKAVFGQVVGVSLLSPCMLRMRRSVGDKWERVNLKAEPRSAYLLNGPAQKEWRKALEDAGIPHIPFHCAGRHTFGTRAAEGGASPKDIQEIMGHTSISTTMRYVHATDQGKRRTVDAVVRVAERAKGGGNVAEVKRAAG